jgi:hypothetical protein
MKKILKKEMENWNDEKKQLEEDLKKKTKIEEVDDKLNEYFTIKI